MISILRGPLTAALALFAALVAGAVTGGLRPSRTPRQATASRNWCRCLAAPMGRLEGRLVPRTS
jgi:hypothetical protein